MTRESEGRPSGASRESRRRPTDAACSVQTREAAEQAGGRDDKYADVDTSHLDDVADGCGCAEVWEHTSAGRREASSDEGGARDAEGPSDRASGPEARE